MSRKSRLKKPFDKDIVNGLNTIKISTIAPLSDLLITVNAIEAEKISLSDMQNLTTVC